MVAEKDGKRIATVQDCTTFTLDDEKYRFVLNAMGAIAPLRRVVSKVVYQEMHWEEE